MRRLAALIALLAAAPAAASPMTCRVEAEVVVSVRDSGDVVEVRRDPLTAEIEVVRDGDGVVVDGDRCERVAEGRFRCQGRHDMVEVAILGTRVRIMSADLGGVSGEAGILLLSGTCEDTE